MRRGEEKRGERARERERREKFLLNCMCINSSRLTQLKISIIIRKYVIRRKYVNT